MMKDEDLPWHDSCHGNGVANYPNGKSSVRNYTLADGLQDLNIDSRSDSVLVKETTVQTLMD